MKTKTHVNYEHVKLLLLQVDWFKILEPSSDVDHMWNSFHATLSKAISDCTAVKPVRTNPLPPKHIRKLQQRKLKLWHIYKIDRDDAAKTAYNNCSNNCST